MNSAEHGASVATGRSLSTPIRCLGGSRLKIRRRLWAVLAGLLTVAALLAPVEPTSGQTTPADPPAAPQGLAGVAATGSVTLTWDDPGDASVTGYQVLRRNRAVDATGVFHILAADTGTSSTAYVDTTVQPESSYVYRVKAHNVAGLGPMSDFTRVDTPYWDTDATRTDAIDLGDITTPGRLNARADSVDGASDMVDYYRFTVSAAGQAEIALRQQDADADLYLEGADGAVLASSESGADASEWIAQTLQAGTYFVRVEAQEAGSNGYRLRYGVIAPPPNSAATGQPAVTGTAAVGETLTADTSGIGDANGLSNVVFAFQWIRSADGTDTDIAGATGSSHTLTSADEDHAIQVRVTFTDDDGYAETLASDAVAMEAAEIVVWSATLTVGVNESYVPEVVGFGVWGEDIGALSSSTFELDGGWHRVVTILHFGGGLWFNVSRALPSDFTLTLSGHEFAAGDSRIPSTPARGRYWWESGSLGWQDGDTVDVSLTLRAGSGGSLSGRALAPPVAYAPNPPEAHDGRDAFSLRLLFSEEVDLDAATLQDHALDLTNGTIATVTRVSATSSRSWDLVVQPDGSGEVAIVLAAGLDCGLPEAVCAADGRQLLNRLELTIPGPAVDDARLSALSLSGVTLNPTFNADTTLYTAEAGVALTTVTVEPTTTTAVAEVEILPADADSATAGHQVTLDASGDKPVTITVTAGDGTTKQRYWVVISQATDPTATPSDTTPARLSGLALSGLGTISFAPETTRYQLSAAPGVSETTVVVSRAETGATVEVLTVRSDETTLTFHRADADDGVAGHQATLSGSGDTLILVRVTSADGRRQESYVVLVQGADQQGTTPQQSNTRSSTDLPGAFGAFPKTSAKSAGVARSGDAMPTLSSLSLTGATISPSFAAATTSYTALVAADVSQVTLSATASDTGASLLIAPADADLNTTGWQIALAEANPGGEPATTSIAVVVWSADGTKLNGYTIIVSRAAPLSDDASLSTLAVDGATLSPPFAPDVTSYGTIAASGATEVTVSTMANHSSATVVINPADADANTAGHQVTLDSGDTDITVTVTAADGLTTRDYALTVRREASPQDATLSVLSLSGIEFTIPFASDTYLYQAEAGSDVSEVTLWLATSNSSATVVVIPADADTSAPGHQVALAEVEPGEPSTTNIAIIVTSSDTSATQTYAVQVTRQAVSVLKELLPERCGIRAFEGSGGHYSAQRTWRPKCPSIVEFREKAASTPSTPLSKGYAHFYEINVEEYSSVVLSLTRHDTSHHYLLRDNTGAVLKHVFYHIDYRGDDPCRGFGLPCALNAQLRAYVEPGQYLLEIVQHYTYDRRQRDYWLSVDIDADLGARAEADADFAADTATTATVGVGVPAFGRIQESGDQDWFAITLNAQDEYEIYLRGDHTEHGSLVDPVLVGIYDSSGILIQDTGDDDGGKGKNSRLLFEAPSTDTYYIAVSGSGTHVGTYNLAVEEPDDYLDNTGTTGSVPIGGSITGMLDPLGDVDWVAVPVVVGRRYRFDIEGVDTGQGTLRDPVLLGVYDADGDLLGVRYQGDGGTTNDDGGDGRNSRVEYSIVRVGTHYLAIGGKGQRGSYRVTATELVEDIAGDTSTTGFMYNFHHVFGNVDTVGDVDWYKVWFYRGWFRIYLVGVDSPLGKLEDPYIIGIYDARGVLFPGTTDDNSLGGNNSALYFNPTARSADYYIAVGGSNGSVGTYKLASYLTTNPNE